MVMVSQYHPLIAFLSLLAFTFLLIHSSILSFYAPSSSPPKPIPSFPLSSSRCDIFNGSWIPYPNARPLYDETCPFHRNAWNCLKNRRGNMSAINSWKWMPRNCDLPRIDPARFMNQMRNKRIGFVGDSLNENFVVSFLCILRMADASVKKWKRFGAWRGAYFPKFNIIVAYHRAVLLAKYQWQPKQSDDSDQDGLNGTYRVDVDVPADDWSSITGFYDVLVFNTGHWWDSWKFPKETPLAFYMEGQEILPPPEMSDGLRIVLKSMVSYIQTNVPSKTLKFWRLQSPRHFYGGEWNQNGSCLFNQPLDHHQVDAWFDPSNNGVNREARVLNRLIVDALQDTDIEVLNVTGMSEFRADAHPAIWLGKKGALEIWGQDCMHWCLPGVPDTWVDLLTLRIAQRWTKLKK